MTHTELAKRLIGIDHPAGNSIVHAQIVDRHYNQAANPSYLRWSEWQEKAEAVGYRHGQPVPPTAVTAAANLLAYPGGLSDDDVTDLCRSLLAGEQSIRERARQYDQPHLLRVLSAARAYLRDVSAVA